MKRILFSVVCLFFSLAIFADSDALYYAVKDTKLYQNHNKNSAIVATIQKGEKVVITGSFWADYEGMYDARYNGKKGYVSIRDVAFYDSSVEKKEVVKEVVVVEEDEEEIIDKLVDIEEVEQMEESQQEEGILEKLTSPMAVRSLTMIVLLVALIYFVMQIISKMRNRY